MKKNVFGRQFKRDANERKALFKNLLTSLVLQERIQTTEAKAKAVKSAADKLITRAKKGGPEAQRFLEPQVNHSAVVKLMNDLGPRFANRQGGYTRIIKVKNRIADNAPQVLMEWTEMPAPKVVTPKAKKVGKKDAKPAAKASVKEKSTVVEAAVSATKEKPGKKEQAQKSGMFKRLVTRQKKG